MRYSAINLTDPAALRADDFQSSCNSRQDKMLELIEQATGKSIVRAQLPNESLQTDEEDDEPQSFGQDIDELGQSEA